MLLALLGYLQADANGKADTAGREAAQLGLASTTLQIVGYQDTTFARDTAYRNVRELDVLALAHPNQREAQPLKDTALMLRQLSRLLASGQPGLLSVEDYDHILSDRYLIQYTELEEKRRRAQDIASEAKDRANDHATQMTLLASTLFLYGLALTVSSQGRHLFVAGGSLIVVTAGVWAALSLASTSPQPSDEAIRLYARGEVLRQASHLTQALAEYKQALDEFGGYARAATARGTTNWQLARIAAQDSPARERYLRAARDDYKLGAKHAGDDVDGRRSALWNLGAVQYHLGEYDDALATNRRLLSIESSLYVVRFNTALTMLAKAGSEDERSRAVSQFRDELDRLAEILTALPYSRSPDKPDEIYDANGRALYPAASTWSYLEREIVLLDSLALEEGTTAAWVERPPASRLQDLAALRPLARELARYLRGYMHALQSGKQPSKAHPEQKIERFLFVSSSNLGVRESLPWDTHSVGAFFFYPEPLNGKSLTWKLYIDGREHPEFRSGPLVLDVNGDKGLTLITLGIPENSDIMLGPGSEYTLDVFVDYVWVGSGSFKTDPKP